jgi:Protein of unknown function (DUF3237)
MTLELTLRSIPIGTTPFGARLEVPFEGTATSDLWDGTREVYGMDHIALSTTGTACIDVHVIISGGDEVITYRGNGRSTAIGVREGVTFETASERLAWLNDAVAIGKGTLDGDHLTVELFLITT